MSISADGYATRTELISIDVNHISFNISLEEGTVYDVHVTVTDGENPISGATVDIDGISSVTGSAGGCTLRNVNGGTRNIEVTHENYKKYTDTITIDDNHNNFDIELETKPQLLPTSIFGLDVYRPIQNVCPNGSGEYCLPTYQCLVVDENMIPLHKPVTVTFEGESFDLTPNEHGICEFNLEGISVGEYSISVKFNGDSEYEESTITNDIIIFGSEYDPNYKKTVKIKNGTIDFRYPVGDENGIQIFISDEYGNPVETRFIVNGQEYIVPDDQPEGYLAELDISEFPAGEYHFIIYHKSDSRIESANSNIWVIKGILY